VRSFSGASRFEEAQHEEARDRWCSPSLTSPRQSLSCGGNRLIEPRIDGGFPRVEQPELANAFER
jgi:hypothetical protein